MYDESLTTEAMNLADGADIHDVAGMVGIYRSVAWEGLDASELERELPPLRVAQTIAATANHPAS